MQNNKLSIFRQQLYLGLIGILFWIIGGILTYLFG